MQKNNKKASILIWSIILSLALSFIFISFSAKINLNLKQNIYLKNNISENEKIEKNLKKIKENFENIKKILSENSWENDEKIKKEIEKNLENIENLRKINENIEIFLQKDENFVLNENNLEFFILPFSEVKISVLSWNVQFFEDKDENWKIAKNKNISSEDFFKKIIVKKIWTSPKINIISNNYIISPEKNFKIFQKIWEKNILKKSWILKIN